MSRNAHNNKIGKITKYRRQFDDFYISGHISKKCLTTGDFNINTFQKNNLCKDNNNIIQSEGVNPFIFEATQVTESSKSCIDLIFINFTMPSTSGSPAVEIDHLPVFTIVYDPELSPFPNSIEFRDFK